MYMHVHNILFCYDYVHQQCMELIFVYTFTEVTVLLHRVLVWWICYTESMN